MATSEADIRAVFESEGLEPHAWSNGAGYRYDWHDHPHHKVLFCLEGSITFHTDQGDAELTAGDRLDLPPGRRHAATVGPAGVTCLEAARPIR
jgi:mannose-6-phosphate isomerase-like protein (cupin superfamily)